MGLTYPFLLAGILPAAVLLFFFGLPVLLALVALVLTDVLFLLGDGMLDVDEDFWLSEEVLRLQKHVKKLSIFLKPMWLKINQNTKGL